MIVMIKVDHGNNEMISVDSIVIQIKVGLVQLTSLQRYSPFVLALSPVSVQDLVLVIPKVVVVIHFVLVVFV